MSDKKSSSLQIGKRAFFSAVTILFILIIISGIMTRTIPSGSYERKIEAGREIVIPGSYRTEEKRILPIYRWFTAPFEVLWGRDSLTVDTIIVLLILISGAFNILEQGGILKAVLDSIVYRFRNKKYTLMAIVIFFFMFLASVMGIYEGMVPMIVIIVPLAFAFGWDSLTGLGMSLLAMAFGFAASITNPFTIGVAQKIAGLPLFSGVWLRVIFFLVVYATVFAFVRAHAKKVEANPMASIVYKEDITAKREILKSTSPGSDANFKGLDSIPGMKQAVLWVVIWIALAILLVIVSSQIESISFLSFPLMGLLFFIAGVGGGILGKMGIKRVVNVFLRGIVNILPAIFLIMLAMSVKHIIYLGGIMDTILFKASEVIKGTPPFFAALLIYLVTMFMNFFIASASAKAFLMMPILAPLSDLVGITRQTTILAFDFGDGFSNMLYPSNALLLVALGFTVVSYPKWIRWTIAIQAFMLIITVLFLLIAVAIHFGPF